MSELKLTKEQKGLLDDLRYIYWFDPVDPIDRADEIHRLWGVLETTGLTVREISDLTYLSPREGSDATEEVSKDDS